MVDLTPNTLKDGITIGGIIGAILGALGIAKNNSKRAKEILDNYGQRLSAIEKKEYVLGPDCASNRRNCPVQTHLENTNRLLERIDAGQKAIIHRMEKEFEEHNRTHLSIARELGQIQAEIKKG